MSPSRVWEMSQRQPFSKQQPDSSGFTLIEVLVSIAVLSIGLMAVALLIGSTLASGTKAKYMSMANVLASEKLDDLNKLSSNDPNIACATTTCGSLTGGASCSGSIYCDTVTVNEASGADYETETEDVNGTDTTTTIVHTNAGCVGTPAVCGVASPSGSGAMFTRRWLITVNPTVGGAAITGARRVTVLVTLNDAIGGNAVNFQMSMVRP
jgi:type IV pilus modification protein PilV